MKGAPQLTVEDDLVPLSPRWCAHVSQQTKLALTLFHIIKTSLPSLLLSSKTMFYLFIAEWEKKMLENKICMNRMAATDLPGQDQQSDEEDEEVHRAHRLQVLQHSGSAHREESGRCNSAQMQSENSRISV